MSKYTGDLFAYKIIKRPIFTEKANDLLTRNTYVFEVAKDVNKFQIRHAIEEIFGVKVTKVNTSNQLGKKKRVRQQIGKTPDWKKAMVTIAKGQVIPLFEGM